MRPFFPNRTDAGENLQIKKPELLAGYHWVLRLTGYPTTLLRYRGKLARRFIFGADYPEHTGTFGSFGASCQKAPNYNGCTMINQKMAAMLFFPLNQAIGESITHAVSSMHGANCRYPAA